jgi:addiction module RelE/StbE family toxin
VKRVLLQSSAFIQRARKLLKKNSSAVPDVQSALELLAADAFHPSLKTHKLSGDLKESWACSAGYDLRIVFQFVEHEGSEAVLLQTIGTHEEVY